ncbi:MAG: hypothetical protein EZS28_013474 [Streblomastix strix]|uniref:EF-hand domain-containing protein n=1 Tax=Streblomastix strix TaxID=222440 RepID=A0A5J4W7Z4_9EUKA|nr:MAG: hypothetical protein EZS28_013474 [Streblomastix strix]
MGCIFANFLEDLYPFSRHALMQGDNVGHKQNEMGYMESQGFCIGASIGNQEPFKKATSDVNGEGKINIVDVWYISSINEGTKSKP